MDTSFSDVFDLALNTICTLRSRCVFIVNALLIFLLIAHRYKYTDTFHPIF